jgi:hypothetical protein
MGRAFVLAEMAGISGEAGEEVFVERLNAAASRRNPFFPSLRGKKDYRSEKAAEPDIIKSFKLKSSSWKQTQSQRFPQSSRLS